ncbi:MAG TPA: hypothetical protein VHP33_05470 [Polyangiaceae bacterium]|nr:hypothetical protein [Polyangiaceae bacterium]
MLGPRIVLGLAPLAACVALLGLSSCSGAEFTSGAGSAGKSSTAGSAPGGTANGGDAGETNSGGAPDPGGSGGSGGAVAGGSGGSGGSVISGCDCDPGQYCRDGTADCRDCAELNRLNFSTPQRLATVSDNGQGSHFPRVGSTNTDLLYLFEGTGLRYTADASTSAGNTVQTSLATDSGPLLLAAEVTGIPSMTLEAFNFVFDRVVAGKRSLYAGQWTNGLQSSERVPAPYNGTGNDYSMAIATKPTADGVARAFWMTTRGATSMQPAALITARIGASEPPAPVDLAIGQADCVTTDADLAPWVTSNGKTLLVSHPRLDANCKATGQGKDIYTALLQPASGEPTAPAVPMNDVNSPMNDVEPSFSADMCDLYFASDRDGKYALYRAHRR